MCNPRQVTVTATRMVDEAWQHAVSRTVELAGQATGEARVRERLGASLPATVLRAFEIGLGQDPEWVETDAGFRHEVEGGYVVYHVDDHSLEIVATASEEVRAVGQAERTLSGRVQEEIQAEGTGRHYDDNWGGRTAEDARRDAEADAQNLLERRRTARIEEERRRAEESAADQVEEEASQRGRAELERRAAEQQAELEQIARRHLDTVGVRARQVFYRSLGTAYRDAILSYARRNGAQGIQCSEDDDVIEIEFMVQK